MVLLLILQKEVWWEFKAWDIDTIGTPLASFCYAGNQTFYCVFPIKKFHNNLLPESIVSLPGSTGLGESMEYTLKVKQLHSGLRAECWGQTGDAYSQVQVEANAPSVKTKEEAVPVLLVVEAELTDY